MTDRLTIGVIDPEVLGTYGDTGNALVLSHRARARGIATDIVEIHLDEAIPADLDLYVMGGGEDTAQALAADHLRRCADFTAALRRGRTLLAICASLQILGRSYTDATGREVAGAEVLDISTTPQGHRSIGELVTAPLLPGLTQPLTGFENHGGATQLGPDARPLGRVLSGSGNAADHDGGAVDGACQGGVVATYMHGPVLARNAELADYLLARAVGCEVGDLAELDMPLVDQLHAERVRAAGVSA
ncbi:glutamine amidotransferase [Nanchangia anserum]|uniref:Lipid II isoglutaminyl synthase (glutamine-hydrolyzing) subunit GatD n=1 Tax=Nanchangia anserum TaxID=2692125 RepID=A0A8I0GEX5_9ACTO|nr:glutamine amidotransferase [Nanchangia anserum]MBD3689592.1 glutamine amidotransferase [Nanchangia anserum]QOX81774.1 glutamine amidotransferase [Nanchangia anserum]